MRRRQNYGARDGRHSQKSGNQRNVLARGDQSRLRRQIGEKITEMTPQIHALPEYARNERRK